MKSRGLIDFYLPSKVAYHIKIVLAGFIIALFFNLIWTGRLINENLPLMLFLLVFQLEIFMYLGSKFFKDGEIKPGISYKRRILKKLLRFYTIVFSISFSLVFLVILLSSFANNQGFAEAINLFFEQEFKQFIISSIIGISFGSLLFLYFEWNNSLKREQKLREEKLIFQYETLKNQVNPHFLFNSLNTLSSLVSKDAELSEKFILKLSSIYRYILENRDVDFINLSKEIEFVQAYFYLQKIRDNGKIELQLEEAEFDQYEILPISIQLLVENALKHNAATRDNPLKIKISIEDELVVVENMLQPKMQMAESSKVGLKNLEERINLVMNKKVFIEPTDQSFIVKVPIKAI